MVLGLAGCSGGASTGGGATVVESKIAFSPSTLTVKAGDVVTFKNQDSVPHDVKIDNKDLGKQSPGQDVTWTAARDGSYPFSCIIHPSMTGQITVGVGGGGGTAPVGGTGGGSAPPAGGAGGY